MLFTFFDAQELMPSGLQVPRSEGLKGAPVALEDNKEEGQSKEERDKAVEQRMDFLSRLAGIAA